MTNNASTFRFKVSRADVIPSAKAAGFVIALVIVASWAVTGGLRWSVGFHPDESVIARWVGRIAKNGYITDCAYPSGWFELHRLHGCAYATRNNSKKEIRDEDAGSPETDDESSGGNFETKVKAEKDGGCKEKKLPRFLRNHLIQDGAVDTASTKSFKPVTPDEYLAPLDPRIQDGRDFNALLYVLTAIFLFFACLESGMRPMTAFLSGLFFCATAAHIEFAHYCETDMGLVVSLSFFAWISSRAIRKKSPLLVLAAGLIAGFAIACKFSLAPLLFWAILLPATIAVRFRGSPRRRIALGFALVLGTLLASAAGYAVGTPALTSAPGWYMEALRKASDGTYAEILANLNGVPSRWGASVLRASQFVRVLESFGLLPLIWGVFAWSFWFRKAFRRYAVGVALLLPLFIPFAIFAFPFVRTQETLPFFFVLAFGSGLPLEWWLRHHKEGEDLPCSQRLAAAACTILGALALAEGAVRAAGISSCFRSRDTRAETQNWLFTSAPITVRIASDHYVSMVLQGARFNCYDLRYLPFRWGDASVATNLPQYFIENVGFEGRLPIRNLRTGRILPEVNQKLRAWQRDTFELKRWPIPAGVSRPTFAQADIRIVALQQPKESLVNVPLTFSRPVSILPPRKGLYDSEGAPGIGARRAETLASRRCTIHVSHRESQRWLVAHMLAGEGEANVQCNRPFMPTNGKLRRDEAIAVKWSPFHTGPLSRLLSRIEAFPSARVRMDGDDKTQLCIAELVADPAEVARLLREGGRPAEALILLKDVLRQNPSNEAAKVEAFLSAKILAAEPDREWEVAARHAMETVHEAVAADGVGAPFSIQGVPSQALRDFSLLRTDYVPFVHGAVMPVYLPPGRYDIVIPLPLRCHPESFTTRVFANQVDDFSVEKYDANHFAIRCHVDMKRGDLLRLTGKVPVRNLMCILEITWDPLEQVSRRAWEIESLLDN